MNLQVFESRQFGRIRTATDDGGNPLFCLADLCNVLDLRQGDVRQRLEDGVVSTQPIKDSLGRTQQANFVNEDGLYDVILDSRKPEAKAFRKWVTSEVLPAIRKHGGYLTPDKVEEALLNPDTLIQLATQLKNERIKRQIAENDAALKAREIEANAPKVLFADSVSASKTCILIGDLAKLLKQNGVNTGQKRLFETLRRDGFLISRRGFEYNSPTQRSMDQGLFEVKETAITHSDGHVSLNRTTKVTGKGQVYFINRYSTI